MQFQRSLSLAGVLALAVGNAQAAEWRGLLDVRAVGADAPRSFIEGGLGKTRSENGLQLGQAVLRGEADLSDSISATLISSATASFATGFTRLIALAAMSGVSRLMPHPPAGWPVAPRAGPGARRPGRPRSRRRESPR